MKNWMVLLCGMICFSWGFAQQETYIDSLKNVWENTEDYDVRMDCYRQIATYHDERMEYETAIDIYKNILNEAFNEFDIFKIVTAYYYLSFDYFYTNKQEEWKETCLATIALSTRDSIQLADSALMFRIGTAYEDLGIIEMPQNPTLSEFYLKEAEKCFSYHQSSYINEVYLNLATLYSLSGRNREVRTNRALYYLDSIDTQYLIVPNLYRVYNLKALINDTLSNKEDAINFYKLAQSCIDTLSYTTLRNEKIFYNSYNSCLRLVSLGEKGFLKKIDSLNKAMTITELYDAIYQPQMIYSNNLSNITSAKEVLFEKVSDSLLTKYDTILSNETKIFYCDIGEKLIREDTNKYTILDLAHFASSKANVYGKEAYSQAESQQFTDNYTELLDNAGKYLDTAVFYLKKLYDKRTSNSEKEMLLSDINKAFMDKIVVDSLYASYKYNESYLESIPYIEKGLENCAKATKYPNADIDRLNSQVRLFKLVKAGVYNSAGIDSDEEGKPKFMIDALCILEDTSMISTDVEFECWRLYHRFLAHEGLGNEREKLSLFSELIQKLDTAKKNFRLEVNLKDLAFYPKAIDSLNLKNIKMEYNNMIISIDKEKAEFIANQRKVSGDNIEAKSKKIAILNTDLTLQKELLEIASNAKDSAITEKIDANKKLEKLIEEKDSAITVQNIAIAQKKEAIEKLEKSDEDKNKLIIALAILGSILLILVLVISYIYRNLKSQKLQLERGKIELEDNNKKLKTAQRELGHRVKNNLQELNCYLQLQSLRSTSQETKEVIEKCQEQIIQTKMIHELLNVKGNELADKHNINQFITKLINYNKKNTITYIDSIEDVYFSTDTTKYIGHVINEILTNTYKYAFQNIDKPTIKVVLKKIAENTYQLFVSDNGIGLPQDYGKNKKSLGIQLIKDNIDYLEGILKPFDFSKPGTSYDITFST